MKLKSFGVVFVLLGSFAFLESCSKQESTSSSTVNSTPAIPLSPPTSISATSSESASLNNNKASSPKTASRPSTSGTHSLDEATKARIDKIKRETIPILASFAQPERFTVEQRRELLIKGLNKGWPAMIEDLQYVVDNLPPGDPEREGFKALLEVTKKAVSKK